MQFKKLVIAALMIIVSSSSWAADGLVAVKSAHSPKETMDRFESVVKQKGMTVFARIDHAAGAANLGKSFPPDGSADFREPAGRHAVYGMRADGGN
jgi:hypothetical protein